MCFFLPFLQIKTKIIIYLQDIVVFNNVIGFNLLKFWSCIQICIWNEQLLDATVHIFRAVRIIFSLIALNTPIEQVACVAWDLSHRSSESVGYSDRYISYTSMLWLTTTASRDCIVIIMIKTLSRILYCFPNKCNSWDFTINCYFIFYTTHFMMIKNLKLK